MQRPITILLVSLIFSGSQLGADSLMPNTNYANEKVCFVGLDQHSDYDFYLVTDGQWADQWSPILILEGEPVHFYKFMDMQLCAVPHGTDLQTLGLVDLDSPWPERSGLEISTRLVVIPNDDATQVILSSYTVTSVSAGQISLSDPQVDRLGEDGERISESCGCCSPLYLSLGAGVVILALLLWARKRRKAA